MKHRYTKRAMAFFMPAVIFFLNNTVLLAQTASLEATFSFKQTDSIYVPFQNGIPVPSFEKQNRTTIDLKGAWKKLRFSAGDNISLSKRDAAGLSSLTAEAQNRFASNYDDSSWPVKQIPSVENSMSVYPNVPENYEDGVWYRYKFTVSDSLKGKFVKLMFHSVNYVADVWLNDTYLGYHEGGYTPFAFDVSTVLKTGASNVLAVRVDNIAWGARNDIVPFYKCDWYNYTGIIGDVYLEASSAASIIRADIVPKDLNGKVQATVTLINKGTSDKNLSVSVAVYNANVTDANIRAERADALIGTTAQISGTSETNIMIPKDSLKAWRTEITVSNPKLWSTKAPNLYVMKVTLKDNGTVIDEYFTQFGIRTITTSGDKALLNGNPVFFTGTARHEDHPLYGRSIPKDTIYSDLKKVQAINANMLRTGHYPNNLYTYLIADRLGLVTVEEIPVWWFDDPEPWTIQNQARHIHEQMFKEMVYKDFNRPSVVLWSTSNECKDVNGRISFINKLKQEINEKFPDGRLLTQSAAADRPGSDDQSQLMLDVPGWTMYFGIFQGTNGIYFKGTFDFLTKAKANNPGKPILDTEFGYWSSENGSSEITQKNVFDETFKAFQFYSPIYTDGSYNEFGFVMGVTWWCIFDWYTCQQISRNGYQSMGLYKMDRTTAKPVADALKNAYALYFNVGGFVTTGVEDNKEASGIPTGFSLKQNYPNPFNPTTVIGYTVSENAHIKLSVFDMLGREVSVLVNEIKSPGTYKLDFPAGSLPGGVYFYRISAGRYSVVKKMSLVK